MYRSIAHICPPSNISPPPLHFQSNFYLANRPTNHGHATKIETWFFVKTPTLSKFPLWSGNARTKPASTEQLRNLPTIASVSVSGVNAIAHWKDKPAECLENAAIYTVANLCQLILSIKFLEDKRSEGRSVSNQLLQRSVIIMFLCQHLGVAPEEGVYMWDKMSDPAYSLPYSFN